MAFVIDGTTYVTGDEAMAQAAEVARPNLMAALQNEYRKTGKLPHAVLRHLKLKPVTLYVPADQAEGAQSSTGD